MENEGKHIKTQLILGNSANSALLSLPESLQEVLNRGKLIEETEEQTSVVEDSRSVNELLILEKNERCKYSLNHYKNKSTN